MNLCVMRMPQVHSVSYVTIEVLGNMEVYELLCILGFNNNRKRMSVSWHINILVTGHLS